MADADLVPIGTFAQAARLTVKALRHYHAVGVLVPAWIDPATGYRHYRWGQLTDALCIATLRDLDVALDRIAAHLVDGVPLHEVLATEREALEERAAKVQRALAVVDALVDRATFPEIAVDTIEWPSQHVTTAQAITDGASLGRDATALVADLLARAGAAGFDVDAPVCGTYPLTLAGSFAITVQLPVPDGTDGSRLDGLEVETFVGGRFARATHVGPHESLPIAYHGLLRDLARRGVPARGPVHERYLDDPATTDPATLRTEVLHRVG